MQLSKHHGHGNDFLVAFDVPVDAHMARALCDRRHGVGADGLIVVTTSDQGADVSMVLLNADGGRAEMSGNGIRCLGQAVARSRHRAALDLVVATDAGDRRVQVRPGSSPWLSDVTAEMGEARREDDGDEWSGAPAPQKSMAVSMGNPHLVLLFEDRHQLDVAADASRAASRNIEFVMAGPEPGALTMRVVERGVGETEACGTGACAAAHAAREWGFVSESVVVHQPGGDALVMLGPPLTLSGPIVHVADLTVEDRPWR